MTVADFAEQHNVDYAVASGFIKFLEVKGLVKENGNKPSATGKGKPSKLYDIPNQIILDLNPAKSDIKTT